MSKTMDFPGKFWTVMIEFSWTPFLFGVLFVQFDRNDKFADVLLFTSQMDGGCGIPAHKIILSSCSHVRTRKESEAFWFCFRSLLISDHLQFFAQVFDSNPAPPNSMIYIVLPPEISRRSIQILIQYMYSGKNITFYCSCSYDTERISEALSQLQFSLWST